jgi:hypothetical protein
VSAVANCPHAFSPGLERWVRVENFRDRTAALHKPEIVINREVGNAGCCAEEEALFAEHLIETFQIQSKRSRCFGKPHARQIRAKHISVFGERLLGLRRNAAEHVRQPRRLQGEGNHGPKQRRVGPLREDARRIRYGDRI